jgi:hypothetical protein
MALHSLLRVIRESLHTALLVVIVFGAAIPAAAEGDPSSRVRANDDALIAGLLREGYERSATFRRLVQTIDRTDGLVYLQRGTCGHGVRACLTLNVIVSGPSRMPTTGWEGARWLLSRATECVHAVHHSGFVTSS